MPVYMYVLEVKVRSCLPEDRKITATPGVSGGAFRGSDSLGPSCSFPSTRGLSLEDAALQRPSPL